MEGALTVTEGSRRIACHGDKVACGATLIAASHAGSSKAAAELPAADVVPVENPCAYVTAQESNAMAPLAAYDRLRKNDVEPLSKPEKGRVAFNGNDQEDALQYTARVNGHEVKIIVLDTVQGKQWAESMNHSLRVLPPGLSQQTDRITLTPYPDPSDTVKIINGERVGKATLGATSLGVVNGKPYVDIICYPVAHEIGLDYTLLHEASHPKIALNSGTLSEDWAQIVMGEPSPSIYGKSDYFEDFCESNALYQAVKGGECEDEFAKAYPKRYERLSKLYQERK